jgi:uncharacterized protein (TIGR02117 family)
MLKYAVMILGFALLMVTGGHFLSLPGFNALPVDHNACADSVDIYVLDKGIHAAIVVPAEGGGINWSEFMPQDSISPHARPPYDYLEFGMGDEAFYINTPEWKDLRLRILIPALFWPTSSVVHITGRRSAPAYGNVAGVRIDECSYRNMAMFIKSSFELEDGNQVFISRGYHHDDGFFRAQQSYHMFYTCNNWVAEALQYAGRSTPLWPLFPRSIMRHVNR